MLKKTFSKQNRALLAELVRTDFKLRYQGSILGYAWSLLKPLMMFSILYIVFAKFLRVGADTPNFPVYLLFGIVLWTFFAEMTQMSLTSIVGRSDLIRKIRIPRWIIVISSSIAALINFGLNIVVVAVFMLFSDIEVGLNIFWLPFIFGQIYILALGFSMLLSAAYVKYRDMTYVWDVVIQAGFYATPILYPLSLITNETIQKLLLINPMAQTIQDSRYVLVTDETITMFSVYGADIYRLIPFTMTILIFAFGIMYFRSQAGRFAENL